MFSWPHYIQCTTMVCSRAICCKVWAHKSRDENRLHISYTRMSDAIEACAIFRYHRTKSVMFSWTVQHNYTIVYFIRQKSYRTQSILLKCCSIHVGISCPVIEIDLSVLHAFSASSLSTKRNKFNTHPSYCRKYSYIRTWLKMIQVQMKYCFL